MDEELMEIEAEVARLAERLDRCRKNSAVLAQAYDSLRFAMQRVRMERADLRQARAG
jgi:uncharacterized membrane protein